jgi:16S rRNA (uracil1498-N3)-methyltransferase
MARRRFFVDAVRHSRATLAGDEARHLRQVLRVEIGQRYEISDNQSVYLAEIDSFGPGEVRFSVIEKLPEEPAAVEIELRLALVKFDRFEWAIEKATELGVARIVPVIAARTEKGLDAAAVKRLERWRKIARESSQQARRVRLAEVCPPARFASVAGSADGLRYFLEEQAGARPILAALPEARSPGDRVALLVGPEGGWTDGERAAASEADWVPVSLGPTVLRSETAAMAVVAILGAAWQAAVPTG